MSPCDICYQFYKNAPPASEIHFPHSDILFPGISKNLSIFCLVLDPNHPDLNKEMVLPTRILT